MTAEKQAKVLLKDQFGFDGYRLGQKEAMQEILAGRDALIVMPTGAGKSLCYQLPALCLPGVTLVVSPLIALMKDQVDDLTAQGIPAAFINSSISATEIGERLALVKKGEIKLLYIAPERFYDQRFIEALKNIKISLFAVDEAHCISEWGHDFRPSYRKLKTAIMEVGRPSVLALTATATPDVRDDIKNALGMENPFTLVTGFDRPNLNYGVFKCTPSEKAEKVLELIRRVKGPTIIYAGTRDAVDSLSDLISAHNISVVPYHAGMDKIERDNNQRRFMEDRVQVMVATNAFGLGIDKPNVRLLIHFDLPGTLEAYYQEAGRAGRDGEISYAVLLYHPSDRYLREFFIQSENPSPGLIRDIYRYLSLQVGEVIHTTYREILSSLNTKAPELAVSAAMKILEHHGYIKRPRGGATEAHLELLYSLEEADSKVNPRAKIQRAVWEVLKKLFGARLEVGVRFSPEELVRSGGITRDSLNRSLRALADKGIISYEPPFRGQEIILVKQIEAKDLECDWLALQEKRRRDEKKLALMEGYAYAVGCRRKFILRYLGDTAAATTCTACDNCL